MIESHLMDFLDLGSTTSQDENDGHLLLIKFIALCVVYRVIIKPHYLCYVNQRSQSEGVYIS